MNRVEATRLDLLFARHDPVEQRTTTQYIVAGAQGMQLHPVEVRYVWPSELDLMARLAGLRLRLRERAHISIYERAG
ncbi:MAG: hypothetical protein AB7T06_45810 [Kofleriaceae bacterium]